MKKTKTVYKVTTAIGRHQYSLTLEPSGGLRVHYPIGRKARGVPGTRLLAFDNLEEARHWAEAHEAPLWKARGTDVRPQSTLCGGVLRSEVIRFWKNGKGNLIAPTGTVSCESITLLERVQ